MISVRTPGPLLPCSRPTLSAAGDDGSAVEGATLVDETAAEVRPDASRETAWFLHLNPHCS